MTEPGQIREGSALPFIQAAALGRITPYQLKELVDADQVLIIVHEGKDLISKSIIADLASMYKKLKQRENLENKFDALARIATYGKKHSQKKQYYRRNS
jgi:hypothetical protein